MSIQHGDIYQYKAYLFTIAYNMVGEIPAAEDLVQDTFEKWLQADTTSIREVKPYLGRMLINRAIDKLEKLKKEREAYKGLWLPQPLITSDQSQEEHTLEYAVMFLLEKLNPYERAVFLMKEVFSFPHQEIATTLNISAENCRQILHRAKDKVRSPAKHQQADLRKQQELLEAFLLAVYQKQFDKLKDIFLTDIVMYQDGGGKIAAALKPISGWDKITKFLDGVLRLQPEAIFDVKPVSMNGGRGVLILQGTVPDSILSLEVHEEKISKLFFVRNPDKIFIGSGITDFEVTCFDQ
jgi:RNA polymerase sigma-70 factor, ECF subfamily